MTLMASMSFLRSSSNRSSSARLFTSSFSLFSLMRPSASAVALWASTCFCNSACNTTANIINAVDYMLLTASCSEQVTPCAMDRGSGCKHVRYVDMTQHARTDILRMFRPSSAEAADECQHFSMLA